MQSDEIILKFIGLFKCVERETFWSYRSVNLRVVRLDSIVAVAKMESATNCSLINSTSKHTNQCEPLDYIIVQTSQKINAVVTFNWNAACQSKE